MVMYKGLKWYQDKKLHFFLKLVAGLILFAFVSWYFDFDERFGHLFKW